jgi:hypothetical protein
MGRVQGPGRSQYQNIVISQWIEIAQSLQLMETLARQAG